MKLLRIISVTCMILLGCKADSQKQNSDGLQYQWSFPDVATKWQPQHLMNGMDTLLFYQQAGAYERLKNHEGYGKLLSKIIDIDSYWYLTSKDLSINDRFKSYFTIYDRVRSLYSNFYTLHQQGKMIYSHEVTLFHNFLISLMKIQLEMTDAFLANEKKLTQIQKEGLDKVIQGAKGVVTGNLIIIGKEYTMYTEDDICSQAQSFYTYYQFLRNRLDEASKNEFDQKVKEVISTHTNECIRKILQ